LQLKLYRTQQMPAVLAVSARLTRQPDEHGAATVAAAVETHAAALAVTK
jgi:hypothetical protein